MSKEIDLPLCDFAKGKTQPVLAEMLGVSQSAVSQMLSSARDIRVSIRDDQSCYAYEIRPIGSRKNPKVA